ncbi:MAG: ATP-binding cassette domain-containing protein [Burkholderiaceae bacterium]
MEVNFEELVYQITTRFDASITPAEARALSGSVSEKKDIKWLIECLHDCAIDSEKIEKIHQVDFERFTGVGVVFLTDNVYLFSFDELRQDIYFHELGGDVLGSWKETMPLIEKYDSPEIYRFFEREKEEVAVIPGIENHWFYAPLWKNRKFIVQAGLASLLTNIFAVGTSLFALIVYNRIIPANAMSSLYMLVIGMVILLTADYAIKTLRSRLLGVAGIESDVVIADKLFGQIIDMKHDTKKGSVGTLASILKEYEQIREFFTSATLVSIIDMPFACIFLFFIWYIGGHMVIPVIIGIFILIGVTLLVQPRLKKLSESSQEESHDKHSVLVETLSGLETVKLLGAGGLLRKRFKSVVTKQAKSADEVKRHTFFSTNLTQEVQQAVQISVVTVGAITVTTGEYGYGAIIACTILSGKALLPFVQLAQLLSRLNQIITGYNSLDGLMRQPTEHAKGSDYLRRGKYKGEVSFENVSYSYPNQDGLALEEISFLIKKGERIGIVGRVGSGKTTIGKLVTKLFPPKSGKILVDGVDISQLDPSEIRENIGYVSQEPWLIAGTVEQNISFGATEIKTEQMIEAANVSTSSDFINAHTKGFKQLLDERGEGLSGGQKQAITIARAIVKKPPILIFDEPTSSMDARTEKNFIDRFKKYNAEATILLITHRTSLLSLVDKVIVVDKGKIVGSGSVQAFLKATKSDKNTTSTGEKSKLESVVGV